MLVNQQKMIMSKYLELYDMLIPKDNILRKIKEMVDFSFVYQELKDKYCEDNGRPANDPIMMFKYLLLKCIENISDVDLVERTKYDLSFKYFLDLAPEETEIIDATSLTKFRRQRLKDVELLDMLIGKTVEIAIEKGLIKRKNAIIVDSTHTNSKYNLLSPRQALINAAKNLRKNVYSIDESMKDKMPTKREASGILEDEIKYCEELIKLIDNEEILKEYPKVKEKLNLLKELVSDTNYQLDQSKDTDARVGHKTADTSFFGFKTHLAMTPERIITGAVITSGEKHDGKQLPELIEKSKKAGIDVEEVIGDKAYAEKSNLKLAKEKGIKLIAKLNKSIMHGSRKDEGKFEYNKDAEMYVCQAGHMAIRKYLAKANGPRNPRETYFFDVEKCKKCPYKEGCYKEGSSKKSYSVTVHSNIHLEHAEFEETEYFKERYKERYKIEAKNGEIKRAFGYDQSQSEGLYGMQIQGALTLFATNMKRIIKLMQK